LSDTINASAFGTSLDRGDEIWIKGIASVPSTGNYWPFAELTIADVANSQCGFYLDSATTPSSVNAAGVFTFSGTAPAATTLAHSPFILGQPLVDGFVYLGVGDSIFFGTGDSVSNGAYGRSYFQRAMHNGSSDIVPSANFAASSAGIATWTGANTKWQSWIPHANRYVDEILTNNVNNQSPATMQGGITSLWSLVKTAGIQKIIRTQLLANCSSTDSYATTVNQTPVNANWDTGGRSDQMNAWFPTQVGGAIESFFVANVLDTDPNLWAVNGVASRMTNDGVHPYENGGNGIGCSTAGAALRSARIALG